MNKTAATFIAKSTVKAGNLDHRRKINFNISKYNAIVSTGKSQFADLTRTRERAKNIKWQAIEKLDVMLEQFEKNISARGAKVIWAETAEDALGEIGKICKKKKCKTLVTYLCSAEESERHYRSKIPDVKVIGK